LSNWSNFNCRVKHDEDKEIRTAMVTCGLTQSNRTFLVTSARLLNTTEGKIALKKMLKSDVENAVKDKPSFLV